MTENRAQQMTGVTPILPALAKRVLRRLDLPLDLPPDLATLRRLVERYTRTVPWESASRIARRARHADSADCVLLGEAFWHSHLDYGTGGTCYESNYAFFALLLRLGYAGYLTVNNMAAAIGCHSAIIIVLDLRKILVDVGLPIFAPLPIEAAKTRAANSKFFRYSAEPLTDNRYEIWRDPHPKRNAFTLIDEPVHAARYRQIAIADYRPDGGLFLDKLVINKVIDERLWRFHSDVKPYCLQQFVAGERRDHAIRGDIAGALAERFGIARGILAGAMELLGKKGYIDANSEENLQNDTVESRSLCVGLSRCIE